MTPVASRRALTALRVVVLIVGAVVMVTPFAHMLSTSFKPQAYVLTTPPQFIPDPFTFDIARTADKGGAPVAFGGGGAHYCLGASLARLEAEVMVTSFVERFPDATLVGDALRWRQRRPFRSLDGLAVHQT